MAFDIFSLVLKVADAAIKLYYFLIILVDQIYFSY